MIQYFYEQSVMHRCKNYTNNNDNDSNNNNNNNNNKMVMITIKTTIIIVMVIIILVITIIPVLIPKQLLGIFKQFISQNIYMSRTESFPLLYQVLFKHAQISSRNLIEIIFKNSFHCVKNVKYAICNHNLKKREEEQITQNRKFKFNTPILSGTYRLII